MLCTSAQYIQRILVTQELITSPTKMTKSGPRTCHMYCRSTHQVPTNKHQPAHNTSARASTRGWRRTQEPMPNLPPYPHIEGWWVEQHHAVPRGRIGSVPNHQKISLQPARVREGRTLSYRAAGRWKPKPARSHGLGSSMSRTVTLSIHPTDDRLSPRCSLPPSRPYRADGRPMPAA